VGDWKLVAAKGDPWKLYNLETDRAEANNLAKEKPELVKELAASWNRQTKATSKLVAKTAKKKPARKKRKAGKKSSG